MVDRFFKFGFMHNNYTLNLIVAKTLIDIVYDVSAIFLSKATKTNQKKNLAWICASFVLLLPLLKQYVRKWI